jgi:pilus assembly protein CpaC
VKQAIVISGSVSTAADAEKVEEITRAFFGAAAKADNQASPFKVINTLKISARDQVMLRVVVSEVQRSLLKQLGVDTQGNWRIGDFTLSNSISFPTSRTPTTTLVPGVTNSDGSNAFTLKALERAGYLKTLAEPTLTAISGESAKFTAGGEIPVPTSNICAANAVGTPSCQTNYGYKPIGVTLSFTPVVINAGRISLHIITEVTEIDPDNGSRTTSGNIPAFRSRKMETTVELASGATLMSAGLIQNQTSATYDRVPGLTGIPVLGELFQSDDYQNRQSELLISVVPYIARPLGALEPVTEESGFVSGQSPRRDLVQKLNSLYRLKAEPDRGLFGFEVR